MLGISERMFYGYRSAKYPVTAKVAAKLEAAERAAGISPGVGAEVPADARIEESSTFPKYAEAAAEKNLQRRVERLEVETAELRGRIAGLTELIAAQLRSPAPPAPPVAPAAADGDDRGNGRAAAG